MTRNIKKLLALVLVLAMAGSTMIVAWANAPASPPSETNVESDAAITFEGGWYDGIVNPPGYGPDLDDGDVPDEGEGPPDDIDDIPDNPTDPPDEPGIDPPEELIGNSSLNFWNHEVITVQDALDATNGLDFHSIRARNGTWDDHDDRINSPADTSLAGMWVRAHATAADYHWNVSVEINEFFENGDDTRPEAIAGFDLTLIPFGNTVLGIGGHVPPTYAIVTIDADDDAVPIAFASHDFVGGRNFEGVLNIPGDTNANQLLTSQAEMFWTFNSGIPND